MLSRPSSTLVDLIRQREWPSAVCRIISHPWDAKYKTSNRSTALHHACLYRAPYDLVIRLVQACPRLIHAQDSQGWTPLHVALLYAADEHVILLLIQLGGANSTSATYISSPLHLACRHGASTRVLQALLMACPALAVGTNESGTRPANLLWFAFRKRHPQDTARDGDDEALQDFLHRLALLVHAAHGQTLPSDERTVVSLHQVIQLFSDLHHLMALLIQRNPTECARPDHDGNLPLHHFVHLTEHCHSILDLLLQAFPSAAAMPDPTGRLPIHVALQSGWTWKTGIAGLVQAHPESLEQPNRSTKLYPAQEAVHDVDTVLELLLRWPVLVQQQEHEQ